MHRVRLTDWIVVAAGKGRRRRRRRRRRKLVDAAGLKHIHTFDNKKQTNFEPELLTLFAKKRLVKLISEMQTMSSGFVMVSLVHN
jgi:hypothetical protein